MRLERSPLSSEGRAYDLDLVDVDAAVEQFGAGLLQVRDHQLHAIVVAEVPPDIDVLVPCPVVGEGPPGESSGVRSFSFQDR
ncbi:hypothetical protein ACQP1G_10690 [Nocardia sp. CA-107356]|uniref:hypothetical protein n=1 Tax=Nocardia sp. CA-107356 TaxID=3239972 RepID=UPI003D8C5348